MGFCDTTDAEVIALTLERRRGELLTAYMAEPMDQEKVQRAYQRLHGHSMPVEPVRFSMTGGDEFAPAIAIMHISTRRKTAAKAWRIRQWQSGNRDCYYCKVRMERVPRKGLPGPLCVTVDHKEPLVLGGDDAPWNWVLACWSCNNKKGALTEAEYRLLRAA